jgi:hypothetical protein
MSSAWRWKGRSVTQVTEALDALVTLRGSIAHRVVASQRVRKKDVLDARDLISRLAAKSSNRVRTFLHERVGKYPWGRCRIGACADATEGLECPAPTREWGGGDHGMAKVGVRDGHLVEDMDTASFPSTRSLRAA